MATVSLPMNRTAVSRNRQPSAVAAPAQPPVAACRQLIDRLDDVRIKNSPEEVQLPSLLEEAETLAKSFEALQLKGTTKRKDDSQVRAARRASRRGKAVAQAEKLPVFTTRSPARTKDVPVSDNRTAASAVSPASIPSQNPHVTAGLSARRTRQAQCWGKAKSDQQVEHTWNGIATKTRVTSLKAKDELDLTTRLKKYFKLKERYDSLAATLGYAPGMDEFARRLGTDKVRMVAAIMEDGPKQKAAMEMKSSAVEGLVHAIKLFDPSRGFKFSTYAHWWVRQSVNKILAVESRVVYIPQNVYDLSVQAQTITAQLAHEYHPSPVPVEVVAEKMNITVKRLKGIQTAVRDPVSMNAPVSSDGDAEMGDLMSDTLAVKADDLLIEDSMQQAVDSYLRQLPAREAGVLRMRYGLGGFERPHTLEEIGFRYAVSRERIRQIEMKAVSELKRSSFSDEMLQYTIEQDEILSRTSSAVGRKSA